MSEFDFLSKVTLGQYFPTASILHRLDPRVKIAGFTLLILVLTFSSSRIGLALGILMVLLGILISKVNPGFALKGLLPPLPFLLIIAVLQVFFVVAGSDADALFTLGRLQVTSTGLLAGATLLMRFIGLILALSLASFCISNTEMISGLALLLKPLNRLGLPTDDLVMVIQVMLRFIPFLAQTAERIAKAQASRGADWQGAKRGLFSRIKQVVPLIIPLFVISLRRSENMALAMDARAYGNSRDRTSLYEFRLKTQDWLFIVLIITTSLAVFCL